MMRSPFQASLALGIALSATLVSACNGGSTFLPASHALAPQSKTTSSPTPIPFKFQTVDDPNSLKNQVNGINQLQKVVGVWGGGQSSNMAMSYTSQPPYTKFRSLTAPNSQGTFATCINDTRTDGGYIIDPGSRSGIWGFLRIRGVWTYLSDPNEGSASYAVTEILGLNDNNFAVGYYVNSKGNQIPMELDVTKLKYTDLQPPGAKNAEATGINGRGDIVGWEATSQGATGFFLQNGTYYTFAAPNATATYASGLNYGDQVAGSYVDSSGTTHGYVLTGPSNGGDRQTWQTVDEPKAAAGTWVTGINRHDDISGYYIDAAGVQHGFVAGP
jgi:hypothetical protein